jgi:hypothetical protein
MIPVWLHTLALLAIAAGLACALATAIDVARHPQRMWIMNVVWPVTALFGTVFTLLLYFRYGRLATKEAAMSARNEGRDPPGKSETPFAIMVAKGASHCGAGCSIGDLCAEWLAYAFPAIAVWFGWHSLFEEKMFAVWILDYVFALAFGIAFQYFTIAPMRHIEGMKGIWQAAKADVLSLSAWQVGMYGFMAIAKFQLFGKLLGARLETASPEFWMMMQIAMLCGFVTSYPVNWWLLKAGIKEKM